ncbi:hypothetical protein JX265_000786 [Neoarthrinium moseri]|uniref:Uncharacterized protein n=1 Tax=Neoarthrinium moseri TaxID=1658444 RepID=A0A9P9WWL7_9PEZI|nr:uncharacterized protein JN550_007108 [Neoarthrinium moseri]KAI1847535.1 hypothetical protein JX266_006387 [Neoarthrinium moseri]KAI1867377.1 hypothetical protein JN550_007108 [Neoarthrinium moseri]KAI1880546.1 hypothetical protein JX265_000786 [Neoarthrinium moseri]
MTWTANPFFTSRKPSADDPEASPRQVILKGVREGFLEPSEHFTGHQAFYLLVPHGFIAAVISGVINMAIAVGMYGTTKQAINLFQFPNTLVGDATVTIILQCIITWLIELILVNQDLRNGRIQPVGRFAEPSNRLVRWFLFLDRSDAKYEGGCLAHWLVFLFSQVLRGFLVAVVSFALFIGPVIGFLILVGTPNGGDWTYTGAVKPSLEDWKPMIFKAILGASLGLLTTPLYALFWMVRCGWALIRNEKHYGETSGS